MKSNRKKSKRQTRRKGFTLAELMVVLVILGLLAGLVTTQVIKQIYKAKVTAVRSQITIFKDAVKQYKIDTSQYPDNSMGLLALVEEPPGVEGWDPAGYLDSGILPVDPWKHEYVYDYTGDVQRPFEIYSLGADGQEGGEGEDADIYEFETNPE